MLKKAQAGTGVLFALFVTVHLANTWLASLGQGAYDGFQAYARAVYQTPWVEALILAALAVHIIVGLMRMFEARKQRAVGQSEATPRQKWHRYSAVFLLIFIGGHITAVRGPSWFYDVFPGFAGLAFSIDYAPYYFYPYYFLLAVGGFYHAVNGLSIALPRLGLRLPVSTLHLQVATGVAGVLTLAALLGFHGVWTDVGDPYTSDFAKLAFEILDDYTP